MEEKALNTPSKKKGDRDEHDKEDVTADHLEVNTIKTVDSIKASEMSKMNFLD
ncbi:MAG: hypothetical protein ACI4TM_01700 [Candidatus Cryptobacteroides sp.]